MTANQTEVNGGIGSHDMLVARSNVYGNLGKIRVLSIRTQISSPNFENGQNYSRTSLTGNCIFTTQLFITTVLQERSYVIQKKSLRQLTDMIISDEDTTLIMYEYHPDQQP